MALPDNSQQPAHDDHIAFLEAVLGDPPDGPINLFSINPADGERHTDWAATPTELYSQAVARATTCNVWFGAAARYQRTNTGRRGGAKDCVSIGGLWVDLDVVGPGHARTDLIPTLDQAYELVESYPELPTAVIESGGGLQAWWLFHERLPVDEASALLDRWAAWWIAAGDQHSWHIDNTWDPARILRVPGTWNRKTDTPRYVELAVWNPDHRYNPDDFDWLPNPPAPPVEPLGERIPYIGPARPGDHFNAAHSCSEVLQANGWTFGKRDPSGDEQWVRPGKDRRQGTSGTVYAADGHFICWTSSVPELRERGSYDPFGLYVALQHRGDFAAATSRLRAEGYGARPVDDLRSLIGQPAADDEEGHTNPGPTPDELAPDQDIDEFLNAPEPEHVWLIDQVIEQGDRWICTGPEGGGKSTLLRQIAVQSAAGVHPFTLDEMTPIRVMILDLENSPRQVRRKISPLRSRVPDLTATNLRVCIRADGLDLSRTDDRAWLESRIVANRPQLVVTGPIYKMSSGDPLKEETAKGIADTWDRLRVKYGFALIIEAHCPYADGKGTRPLRPYGASLWSRWPEFGVYLSDKGAFKHWRGQRDERRWPVVLRRGDPKTEWPWVEPEDRSASFMMMIQLVASEGRRMSYREIADRIGVSKTTVERAVTANRAQWDTVLSEYAPEDPTQYRPDEEDDE